MNLSTSIQLCSAIHARIFPSDSSNNEMIFNLLRGRQANLEQESDYDEDFTLNNKGEFIKLEGNIKSCLICLRHAGLLHPDVLNGLVDIIENVIKKEGVENSLVEKYDENFKIALERYPLDTCAPFPLTLC